MGEDEPRPRFRLIESPDFKPTFDEAAQEYVHSMVPHVVGQYLELGLHPSFAAILGRHIDDLKIVSDVERAESCLSVVAHKSPDKNDDCGAPTETVWIREAIMSPEQHLKYLGKLALATKRTLDIDKLQPEIAADLKKLSFDWIFFELTADAAGSSCYFQQKFNKYIPDYNGSSPHFRTDLAISDNYLSGLTDEKPSVVTMEADHIDFRAGMALVQLHDALLRSELGLSVSRARFIINQLSASYPQKYFKGVKITPEPHSQNDVILRLSSIEPRDPFRDMPEYLEVLDAYHQEQIDTDPDAL